MNVLNCVFAGISAFSAAAIGVAAFFISKAQLKIDKHKKDDFLYDKRFQVYNDIKDIILSASSELFALNNKEIDGIDAKFVRPLYNKVSSLISDADLLFKDENIRSYICELRLDVARLFGVNNIQIVDDDQKCEIIKKWDEQMSSGYMIDLFGKYLKLI